MRWRSTGARYSPASPWTCSLTGTGLAAALLDHPQRDRCSRGRHRARVHAAAVAAFDLRRPAPPGCRRPKVEAGLGVGGVFDQHLAGRRAPGAGCCSVLARPRSGRPGAASRDHLAQVELDLLEQAVLVQLRLEGLALRQRQAGLAARLPAQREASVRLRPRPPRTITSPATGSKRKPAMAFSGWGFSQAHSQFTHGPSSAEVTRVCVPPQSSHPGGAARGSARNG